MDRCTCTLGLMILLCGHALVAFGFLSKYTFNLPKHTLSNIKHPIKMRFTSLSVCLFACSLPFSIKYLWLFGYDVQA